MAGKIAERVGERIRSRRLELGLNQRQLADRIEDPAVGNQHISNWERGVYRPSDRYLGKLATALGVDVAYLVTASGSDETAADGATGSTDLAARLADIDERLAALSQNLPAEIEQIQWAVGILQAQMIELRDHVGLGWTEPKATQRRARDDA